MAIDGVPRVIVQFLRIVSEGKGTIVAIEIGEIIVSSQDYLYLLEQRDTATGHLSFLYGSPCVRR